MGRRMSVLGLLIALLVGAMPVAANTKAGTPVLFKETGHTLAYGFRQFWDGAGGLQIMGYPLTEVFIEDGRPVQYFERARLEWHANLGIVLAGHLGRWAADHSTNKAPFAPRSGAAYPNQIYFPESRHTLGGLFRQFWENNGGLQVFGYPLSEEFLEVNPQDGKTYTVQYFERTRFEYHPDLPAKYQVSLGHLGRQYMEATGAAPRWSLDAVKSADVAWDAVRPTRIRMPRISLDTSVVEAGFSVGVWDVPRYSAAHYWPVGAYPGTAGNIVLAGHVGYRDTIFNHLPNARVGDELYLTSNGAERRYSVSEIMTLLPEDTWVLNPTDSEVVTLITCVPIGVYSHRLIVRATPKP
jgi:LPXTG-site transpeptidase (sortase) family protein